MTFTARRLGFDHLGAYHADMLFRTLNLLSVPFVLGGLAAASMMTYSTPAEACGGNFCDVGPTQVPVNQTGENIIFAFDGDTVEVHIQIAYDPDTEASKFSWIIPMQALPEFGVSSELFFDQVLNGTVPTYGLNQTTETCGEPANGPSGGLTGASASGSGGDNEGTDSGGEPGPNVVYSGTVGAFAVTVIDSPDSKQLLDWFDANGYSYDDAAVPIIDAYLAEGNLFAAFKLVPAEKPVVHPVVLRYQGVEPCVPIRLTRVAAVEDMDIRVFFLGDHRAIPTNYRHVLVNPLKIDWPNFAANYKEVVTAAVDAFQADGNAFVTEYAGPSDVISPVGIYDQLWDAKAFTGLAPIDVVDTLGTQNIMYCYGGEGGFCDYRHPLLEGLLGEFLPPPNGLDPVEFYSCLSCYEGMIDVDAWGDGSAFSTAYDERIVTPGKNSVELLGTKPYVTRMYTTISPHEMLEDPMFAENPDLPDIASLRIAQKLNRCDGHAEYTLPDGREVFVPDDGPWPEFPEEMPWEEETQQMALVGAPQVLLSNTETIDTMLEDWNAENRPAYDANGDTSGDDGAGCGCTSKGNAGGLAFGLGLLGLVGLRRRRRR